MDSKYPKFFEEFLSLQKAPVVSVPHNRNLLQPPKSKSAASESCMTFDRIVEKKPKPKVVLKYLQGMIDDIVAEND